MVTKGIFWKRFYFVVSLLLCNCFLLCCNGFCDRVKKLFGWGQSGITNGYDQDGNPIDNINNNSNEEGKNSEENSDSSSNKGENSEENSDSSSKEEMENSEEDNNNSNEVKNSEEDNNNSNKEMENSEEDNDFGETIENENNNEDDKNEIDLSGCNISKDEKFSDTSCKFLSTTTSVGKTSILNRLKNIEFDELYVPTIGIDYFTVAYTEKSYKTTIKIQLWDNSGEKKYNTKDSLSNSLKCASAIVFVYDITNAESFNNLADYIKKVKELTSKGCLFFLLGNKLDMDSDGKRRVTTKEAQKLAAEKGLIFLGECSAKDNTYTPVQELYCKQKGLVEYGKCKEGLSGMLKDIVYKIVKSKQ